MYLANWPLLAPTSIIVENGIDEIPRRVLVGESLSQTKSIPKRFATLFIFLKNAKGFIIGEVKTKRGSLDGKQLQVTNADIDNVSGSLHSAGGVVLLISM